LIAPKDNITRISRRYEASTLVLETVFETATGSVAVTDFMPPGHTEPTIHRIVEGREGIVEMNMELIVRFEYGAVTPWVTATGDGLRMVAGSDGPPPPQPRASYRNRSYHGGFLRNRPPHPQIVLGDLVSVHRPDPASPG
jgi:hypothetical protein